MRATLLTIAAAAALVTPLAATPAHAVGPDAFAMEGTGTIAPGLPCPSTCAVHLDFTMVLASDTASVAACTFDGDTGPDTVQFGNGNGYFFCSDGSYGPVHFDRFASYTQIRSDPTVQVHGCKTMTGVLDWTPTTAPTVTTFSVWGGGTLTDCTS